MTRQGDWKRVIPLARRGARRGARTTCDEAVSNGIVVLPSGRCQKRGTECTTVIAHVHSLLSAASVELIEKSRRTSGVVRRPGGGSAEAGESVIGLRSGL